MSENGSRDAHRHLCFDVEVSIYWRERNGFLLSTPASRDDRSRWDGPIDRFRASMVQRSNQRLALRSSLTGSRTRGQVRLLAPSQRHAHDIEM